MTGFEERLSDAQLLEQTFIEEFNKCCGNYKIIKYGIESTKLTEIHHLISKCRDGTSRFVRYIPDSVLVNTSSDSKCDTTLIEFKAAKTGVQNDSFLRTLSTKCPGMDPPFTAKEDIFNVENDALDLYGKLQSIGAKIIIVAPVTYRMLHYGVPVTIRAGAE